MTTKQTDMEKDVIQDFNNHLNINTMIRKFYDLDADATLSANTEPAAQKAKFIYSKGTIYDITELYIPRPPYEPSEVHELNERYLQHVPANLMFQVIGSHTFTEGQQVVLGVDYEKGYQGWNFIEQKWEDVTQEDYEHLLDPARCIIAKPLPVNQSVNEEKDGAILGWGTKENVQSVMGEEVESEAWKVWEEDQKTNPNPVNPYAFVYGYNIAKKKYNK